MGDVLFAGGIRAPGANGSVHPLHNAGDINRKDNPMTDSTKGNPSPPRTFLPTFIWHDGDSPGLYAYPGPEREDSNPSRGPEESRPEDRVYPDLLGANLCGADLLPADLPGWDVPREDSNPSRGPEESRPEDRADTDPREPESPQVDPADEFIDALRRLEVLEPTGYSDIVPRSFHVSLRPEGSFLKLSGTSPSRDLKEKKARRMTGKCFAVALVLTLVGAALFTWTGMGGFPLIPGVLGLLLAGALAAGRDDFLGDPALIFPVRIAGTGEEFRSLARKLGAAWHGDSDIFTSALQVLAGESTEEANPEVRERALNVLRDLYLKSEERRLDLDQPQTIEKLNALAALEARIEMLD